MFITKEAIAKLVEECVDERQKDIEELIDCKFEVFKKQLIAEILDWRLP